MISRRNFLRGALGTTVALPLLSTLGRPARAVPPVFPKRFVCMFSPHGIVRDQWKITGDKDVFTLGGILAPLEPHKKDLVLLRGVDMLSAEYGPGDQHQEGTSALLGGVGCLEDPMGSGGLRADTLAPVGWGGGITLDQFLAKGMGAATKLPSLEVGVLSTENVVAGRISYLDAGKPVPPVNDPALVYDRIFSDLILDPVGAATLRRERKSVLDAVQKQFTRIRGKLSPEDRDKLDAHADAVRGIEMRLDLPGGITGGACLKPERPNVDPNKLEIFPTIGKLQMDLMVLAFACDVTRVATIMWAHAVGSPASPWLGISEGHHTLSHTSVSDTESQNKLTAVTAWHSQQLAYLIQAMKNVPEGDGTMLDNTVILWGSEVSVGNSHSHRDMPFVIAGGCGGAIKTGQVLTFKTDAAGKGPSHNDMLLALAHAMGRTEVTSYGNPSYCTGVPLPGLLKT
ncbi:MAG: DUF1552 domain-containing protein [Polyangiales bacterium]